MDEAEYKCDEGFKHQESSSNKMFCSSDANFEHDKNIACVRITCPDPFLPQHGYFFLFNVKACNMYK